MAPKTRRKIRSFVAVVKNYERKEEEEKKGEEKKGKKE